MTLGALLSLSDTAALSALSTRPMLLEPDVVIATEILQFHDIRDSSRRPSRILPASCDWQENPSISRRCTFTISAKPPTREFAFGCSSIGDDNFPARVLRDLRDERAGRGVAADAGMEPTTMAAGPSAVLVVTGDMSAIDMTVARSPPGNDLPCAAVSSRIRCRQDGCRRCFKQAAARRVPVERPCCRRADNVDLARRSWTRSISPGWQRSCSASVDCRHDNGSFLACRPAGSLRRPSPE